MKLANEFPHEREHRMLFPGLQRGVVEGGSFGVRGSQPIWQHEFSGAISPGAFHAGLLHRPRERGMTVATAQSAAAPYEVNALHGHTTPTFCYTPSTPLPRDETPSLDMWRENNLFENFAEFQDIKCGNNTMGTARKAPGSQCSATSSGSDNTCSIGSERSLTGFAASANEVSTQYQTSTNHDGEQDFSTGPCSTNNGRQQYTFVDGLECPMKEYAANGCVRRRSSVRRANPPLPKAEELRRILGIGEYLDMPPLKSKSDIAREHNTSGNNVTQQMKSSLRRLCGGDEERFREEWTRAKKKLSMVSRKVSRKEREQAMSSSRVQ